MEDASDKNSMQNILNEQTAGKTVNSSDTNETASGVVSLKCETPNGGENCAEMSVLKTPRKSARSQVSENSPTTTSTPVCRVLSDVSESEASFEPDSLLLSSSRVSILNRSFVCFIIS